jgi:hypothetical protein
MLATPQRLEGTREVALAALDAAHNKFERALRAIPDAALVYRPPADDFALGGILVHVAEVLAQYAELLQQFRAADLAPVRQAEPACDAQRTASIRAGLAPQQRAEMIELLRVAHAALVVRVCQLPEDQFTLKVPVMFCGSTEHAATSAEDVVGWMRAHYVEHIAQIGALLACWRSSRP